MTSSDHDQTSVDRYGQAVHRAYTPFSLSTDQRQRHHALLDQAARRRATGRLRPHLAEAAAIATIALLVILTLVTWQALQPEDDERSAAPPASAEPTTSAASPVDDRSTEPQALYMLNDGDIVAIDPATGEELLHIDANTRFDYPFEYPRLAVSHETGRVAVPDLLGDSEDYQLGVKIYRMSDGALDREISIQTILRCIGGPCINITFSQDGQRLHVQQYETQPGEVGNQADYWLGTFDLNEGKWLSDVELQGCGSSNHLEANEPHEVIALCSKAGLYVVDTEHFTARHAGYRLNSAAMVTLENTFLIVYDDRTICEQPRDGDRNSATCHSTAKVDSSEDYVQPAATLGISPDGSRLYVPMGTKNVPADSERNYITSKIAVISTENWTVERTIDVGFSFAEIVFNTDGSTAYVISEHEDDVAKLVRIDLQSGDQSELASGAISSLVIAPRRDDEAIAAAPISTPESDTAMQLDYEVRSYDVVGINPETGEEMQHIDVNIDLPSPILAASHESGRIAVGDLVEVQNSGDQPGSSADGEYGVKIYRMSDGSLEQQIPAAGLVTCREACEAIIFSPDGKRLHVYQRDWPGGADASSIRYLLTTYDLEAQEWLQDVDLGKCGLVDSWRFVGDQILQIECSNSDPAEINTLTFTVVNNSPGPVEEAEQSPAGESVRYTFRDGDVVGIDRETGEEVQHIDVNIGSQSPFLAVSYESGRIAVGDFLRHEDEVELGVKVYRMSDGSLEQEIPVPTMMRCMTRCEGLIFSLDGQRLHIYQYEIPPEANGNGDLADYWLGTFDLDSRQWMRDVDMGSCGAVFDFTFLNDKVLKADCGLEIDTATFTVVADQATGIDTGADEAYFVGADGDHVVWITPDDAIHAAAIEDPEPFTLVGASDLKSDVRFDNGVVVWSEPDPGCATGCASAFGKRVGEDETFVIAPGGDMDGVEVSDAYVAISYPWVAWLRFTGRQSELLVRNIETMAEPVTLAGPSDVPLEPPVIDGDRVVWMEEPNELDPNLPNRLLTKRIGGDEATLIAENVEPLSYAVGGDLIIYADLATDTLFAHRISTGEVVTVYEPGGTANARPQSPVTDGRYVFWLEGVPTPSGQRVEHRIRGYDIETGATFDVAGPSILSPSLNLVLNDGQLAWLTHDLEGTDTIHTVSVQSIDKSG